MNLKKKMIDELCIEKGIEKSDISYGWISILKKGDIEKKLINNNFYLNTRNSVELAKDKYSTYELLNYYKIPIIKHTVLFNEERIPDCAYINDQYRILKNDDKVVIKGNDSSQGKDVYVCDLEEQKINIVNQLMQTQEAVVICPYMEIEYEYRVIFLYGEVIYIYKKQKPFVIGDGKSNIRELIEHKLKYLIEPMEGLNLEDIPAKDEKVTVGWKHNLSNGAIPIIVDENDVYYNNIKNIALNVGKRMELNFASIDICVTKQKQIFVMEVNSNVTVAKFCELAPNGYEIGKQIYAKVIDKIFEKGEEDEIKK